MKRAVRTLMGCLIGADTRSGILLVAFFVERWAVSPSPRVAAHGLPVAAMVAGHRYG